MAFAPDAHAGGAAGGRQVSALAATPRLHLLLSVISIDGTGIGGAMITDTTTTASRALGRRALLIGALAAAGLLSSLASAATLDEIKKRGYLVVVTEDDFRPFEYIQ